MFKVHLFFVALIGLFVCVALTCDTVLAETWSDNSGKFQVEAEFVGIEGEMVSLRKRDGMTIKVPMSRLSNTSQALAKRLATNNQSGDKSTQRANIDYSKGRVASGTNIKQMVVGMHSFLRENGAFPDDIKSDDGTPLLSWRVAILPYIGAEQLYKQFNQKEPWDSPSNSKLIDRMPKLYVYPGLAIEKGATIYQRPRGEAFLMDPAGPVRMGSVTDGLSMSIIMVETNAEHAVTWTKPMDLTIDQGNPFSGVLDAARKGFNVAFADGSVQYLSGNTKPSMFYGMLTKAGGETIDR